MSRLGKRTICIPENVDLEFSSDHKKIKIKGPLGILEKNTFDLIKIVWNQKDKTLKTEWNHKNRKGIEMWGTVNSLLYNWVQGVHKGFEKRLLINGLGFKAKIQGQILELNLGFSHLIKYPIPQSIKIDVEKNTILKITGIDKELVGLVASQIRKFYKTEPYKGKGIMYYNEQVQRKVGKTAVSKK